MKQCQPLKLKAVLCMFLLSNIYGGMVLMVSIAVSKTEGPGSSPGTPANIEVRPHLEDHSRQH